MEGYKHIYRGEVPEALLDQANIGLWKWNLKNNNIHWSASFRRIWGIKNKTHIGKYKFLINKIHSIDRDRVVKKINDALSSGNGFYIVFRVKHSDGNVRWLSNNGVVVRDDNGEAIEIQGLSIDITRSKTLEKELKRSISQLQAVFTSVKVGITVEVKSGYVVYSNVEMGKILGKEASDEVNNHSIRELLKIFVIKNENGEIVKIKNLPAAEVFRGKKKVSRIFSFENKKTGVVRWFKITATAVDSEKLPTEMVVKVFQDITKEYEQQQNTLASLGVASHELKNALAGVKAYIELVKRRLNKGDWENAKNYTANLDVQSTRLIKLINDLLDVSRIQSGFLNLNKKKFNYSELLESVVSDFKNSNKDNPISLKIKKNIKINADQERIIQVLLNLLSNAVKYSEIGSKITISVFTKDKKVITAVKDSGFGIQKSDKNKIFELFKRGNSDLVRKTKGLGIGLYTSNEIVKAHQGIISLKSKLGQGSTFYVELPQ